MTTPQAERAPNAASKASSAAAFRRLHPFGQVGVRTEACLHLHNSFVGCRRCEAHCPHGSLTLEDGRLALDPTCCTGCGLCAASCPTAALAVDGCTITAPAAGAAVTLSCEGVAATSREPGGHVTCLAALTVNDYLRLALAANGARIQVLIDEATCRRCPTPGRHAIPAHGVLEAVRRTLAAAGVPTEAQPHPVAAPLPNGNTPVRQHSERPAPGRRAFFAGLSRALSAGIAQATPSPLVPSAETPTPHSREPVFTPRGAETRLLILALARRHGGGGRLKVELPDVTASDACRAHGACARACPSGALVLERDETHATLSFDAWQCLDCGACERVCPEQALSHATAAWREAPAQAQVLAAVVQAECVRCGALMAASDDSTLCDRCTKSGRLAHAGFALFHPAHRESAESP